MKKFFCILGMIAGFVMIAFGLYTALKADAHRFVGDSPDYASFGADYYTYQYDATRDAASNVKYLGNYVNSVVDDAIDFTGYVTAAFGLVIVCAFGCKLAEPLREKMLPAVPATSHTEIKEPDAENISQ